MQTVLFIISALWNILFTSSILVTPNTAPMGFNSFDNYRAGDLNASVVENIADAMKNQLLSSGYDTLVIDGGWTTSYIKLPNGTVQRKINFDEYGRPVPAPERYPSMKELAKQVHSRGLKFGLWAIRGVHVDAVAKKLPIEGTQYTVDQLVDILPVGGGKNGSCLWAHEWLGVNKSHPAAQAYYDSRVELLLSYDIDFIKADCMMCGPCYTDEMEMFTSAIKRAKKSVVLSYSPGGGNHPQNGQWVKQKQMCSMYRVVTDFHGGWYGWGGLQQAIFILGNFSAWNLIGANNTYPDPDMLPLDHSWWTDLGTNDYMYDHSVSVSIPSQLQISEVQSEKSDRGQTIMSFWIMARAPLMYAGRLPTDQKTLSYLTNPNALEIHQYSQDNRVVGYFGNCTCKGDQWGSCTIPHDPAVGEPCVVKWAAQVPSTETWTAALITNMGETTTTVWSLFSDFLPTFNDFSATKYEVLDIWKNEKIGIFTKGFNTTLRSHASMMYKISECHAGMR